MTGNPSALASGLRAHAAGLPSEEAAAELLIQHAVWLHRDEFVHVFVATGPLQPAAPAAVHWPEAVHALNRGDLACSRSEGHILRLAASLAAGIPVDLREAVTGLDRPTTVLICHAIRHATGHP